MLVVKNEFEFESSSEDEILSQGNVSANAFAGDGIGARWKFSADRNRNGAANVAAPTIFAAAVDDIAARNPAAVTSIDRDFCDDDDCDCVCKDECCTGNSGEKVLDRHAECFIPNFVE